MRIAAGLVLVLGVATARAEPGRVAAAEPPGMTAPTAPTTAVASIQLTTEPGLLERTAATDAAFDRGFLVSTALALRPGQFDVSLRSALKTGAIVSVAAGLGRGIEVSVDGTKMGGVGKTLGAGMKIELARHPTWSIAATGSIHSLYAVNSSDTNLMYLVGMRITTCTGSECSAQFTFGGGFGASSAAYTSVSDTLTPELDASFIIGKSWCRPLLELTILDGELGFLGLRFGGRYVAFDAGVGAVLGDNQFHHSDLLALVGLSVRP